MLDIFQMHFYNMTFQKEEVGPSPVGCTTGEGREAAGKAGGRRGARRAEVQGEGGAEECLEGGIGAKCLLVPDCPAAPLSSSRLLVQFFGEDWVPPEEQFTTEASREVLGGKVQQPHSAEAEEAGADAALPAKELLATISRLEGSE